MKCAMSLAMCHHSKSDLPIPRFVAIMRENGRRDKLDQGVHKLDDFTGP